MRQFRVENIRHIIVRERKLVARETFSRGAFDCSESMSENCKDRYLSYLIDKFNETALDKKAMELVLEDFFSIQKEMKEELASDDNRSNNLVKTI